MPPSFLDQDQAELSPYAVEGRYDFITDENIDIRSFVSLIEDFKHFVDIQIGLST